jgi:hypothetical protein
MEATQTVKTRVRGDKVARIVVTTRPRTVTWEQLIEERKTLIETKRNDHIVDMILNILISIGSFFAQQ